LCEDIKGNKWYDISLNGAGYPKIEEVKRMQIALSNLYNEMEKLGENEIDKINQEIWDWQKEEMMRIDKPDKERRKQKKSGYVYLLKSRNLYKIGRAKNMQNRMKFYKTENPFKIKVIFQKEVDDYIGKETELLKKFKDKNYKGEWFSLNSQDIKWIKQNL
jgi:hypothetical protein